MKIYLDDDAAQPLLARLLRQAGHDVQLPADANMRGSRDPVHFTHAIRQQAVLLSRNDRDFRRLHELVITANGHHPGLFVVRFDNDAPRDLTPRGVVNAIAKLIASGMPIPDDLHVLNHWR